MSLQSFSVRGVSTGKRFAVCGLVALVSLSIIGCETLPGTLAGGAIGGGLAAIFGADAEVIAIAAIGGAIIGHFAYQHWQRTKARRIAHQQTQTQEQVNQQWQTEGNPVPRTPEVAIVHDRSLITPGKSYYTGGDPMGFKLAYTTLGENMSDVAVCRTDNLGYYDGETRTFTNVKRNETLLQQCDLVSGSGEDTSGLDLPPQAQNGVYAFNSTVELKRNGVVVDDETHSYFFAIGSDFVDDIPAARQAAMASMAREMLIARAR